MVFKIFGIFSRKRVYEVYLTARGKKKFIGEVEGKDWNDVYVTLQRFLEELQDEGKERLELYPRILLIDKKTGERLRLRNPFCEEEEEETTKRNEVTDVQEGIQRIVLGSLIQQIPNMVGEAVKMAMDVNRKIIQKTIEAAIPVEKEEKTSIKDIAMFIREIINLANNYDKVKKMMKEADIKKMLEKQLEGEQNE